MAASRLEVVALALVALVIGGLVAYQPSLPPKSRQYSVGTSSVRILVDTTDSQVVAIAPPDQPAAAENLGGHASLLAQLLSQGVAKAAVAKHAGVAPDKLIMIAPTEPNQKAESPVRHSRTADVLAIHTLNNDSGEPLPIIGVDAQAANGERAARLASAAVAGLEDYLKSKAAADGVPPDRQLLVRALSVAQGRDVTRGPSTTIAIGVAILVFGLLCALLLVVPCNRAAVAGCLGGRAAACSRLRRRRAGMAGTGRRRRAGGRGGLGARDGGRRSGAPRAGSRARGVPGERAGAASRRAETQPGPARERSSRLTRYQCTPVADRGLAGGLPWRQAWWP